MVKPHSKALDCHKQQHLLVVALQIQLLLVCTHIPEHAGDDNASRHDLPWKAYSAVRISVAASEKSSEAVQAVRRNNSFNCLVLASAFLYCLSASSGVAVP